MIIKSKYIGAICAAVILIVALVIPASAAASVQEQMAANSAAWWVAYNAGDQATMDALHAANVALANQAASGGGNASYNSVAGTWDITTAAGDRIVSSGAYNGDKMNAINYATYYANGAANYVTNNTYTDSSINAYMNAGGTNDGLRTSYNNAAAGVTANDSYGDTDLIVSAADEVAVAKELLGLTDSQAEQLQTDLEVSKREYEAAQNEYQAALASGDSEAAAAAKAKMDAAHADAEATRAQYNYTSDSGSAEDGGYYYDSQNKPTQVTGGFFMTDVVVTYRITASCNEGGSISPSGTVTVKAGESQTFTVTPDVGYKIKSLTVDGVNKGALSGYTFSNVRETHTISVIFEKKVYEITSSAGTGGVISPDGATKVSYGGSKTYVITPDTGYEIRNVTVDGVSKGALSTYTFSNVKETHTISVVFEKKVYEIAASAGTGGTISPNGTTKVEYGGSKTYTIAPNTGYEIKSVTVDGVNKGALSTYTFNDIKKSHTISATFSKKSYNISASAGEGGSITPNGTTKVYYGSSKTYTITSDSGFKIEKVTVDGVNKGAISSYTFGNVRAAHTISATFVPSGVVSVDVPSVTDELGANVVDTGIKSGYGIFARVSADYEDVTEVKMVMTYNFGDGRKTIVMDETCEGVFQYPVNAQSPLGKRCVYIPVETADGEYTLTFTLTAQNAAGEELKEVQTAKVKVKGSMYEDDFTGDS